MASAVLAMSVHPVIHPDDFDNHVYNPSALDFSGLAKTIDDLCRGGNSKASVRIADTYIDIDGADEIQRRFGKVAGVQTFGEIMMNRTSVPGKSRNGVITVADEWSPLIERDLKGPQFAPSVFFIAVRASTSLTVGDWLHQALALFYSFHFPPGLIEAFTGNKSAAPSAGRLPGEVADKLEAMFGLMFKPEARLTVVCRK